MGPPGLPQLPQLILNDNFEDPLSASQTGGVYEVGQYRVGEMLGAGTFGVVRKAVHLPTGKEVAAKILFLPTIGRERRLQLILEEVAVLKINRHPNIIRLLDAFEGEDQKYYLVFELCTGGELYDRIVEAQRFTERTAGVLLATIIAAVAFLHEPPHQIIHRDLKLENILFKSEAPNSPLVIVDFGVALMLEDADETSSEIVGSRPNMAPELIQGKEYGAEVDVYALGVIAYTLLSGCHPFQEEMEDPDPRVLNAAIINGRFSFEDKDWSHVSEEAKEFVASLMSLNPADRPTAAQALASPWL
ncbi:kinase-like domain-containing protein, partial [Hyaloraphidium curvatum]